MYRSPVFHHPPLIPLIIKIFSTFLPPVGAARLMNALFYALLLWATFWIAYQFEGALAAVIAFGLASICPIINLEARLIHLDLPMTAFLLLGTHLFLVAERPAKLAGSGAAFAAAFLCRFTGPLFLPIPAMLFLGSEHRRRASHAFAFFSAVAFGFLWWVYIIVRFGTLVPEAFHLAGIAPFTDYLRSVAQRHWYDLFLYFFALCPLFVLYPAVVAQKRTLIALNAATWISVAILACLVATGSAYWMFRYFLPIVAVIYISLGCIVSRLLLQGKIVWNSYLAAAMMFNAFVMMWSTATTVNRGSLEPIPVALFWAGLGKLFH